MVDSIRVLHLLAASVWTGGLIVLAFLVLALRRAGAERTHLQAAARMFGRVSWTAMGVSLVTGVVQLLRLGAGATDPRSTMGRAIFVKLLLVGLAAGLTLFHQMTAASTTARVRGMIQGSVILVSIGIIVAATRI